MIITEIKLERFCQFKSLHLKDLPVSVAFFGHNGSGKTTLLNAVRWAMFGYCTRTDKRGAGSSSLVGYGAHEAKVDVTVEHQGEKLVLSCSIYNMSKANEFYLMTGDGEILSNKREDFWSRVGIPLDNAKICAMPNEHLLSQDISDALGQMLKEHISGDDIKEYLDVNGGFIREYSAKKHIQIKTIDDLVEIGGHAYRDRSLAKKDLAQAESDLEGITNVEHPKDAKGNELGPADIQAVKSGIEELLSRRDALLEELGSAKRARDARPPVSQSEIKRLQADKKKIAKEIEDAKKILASVTAEHTRLTSAQNKALSELQTAKEKQQKLKQSDKSTCPTCNQTVDVSLLLAQVNKACNVLQNEVDAATEQCAPTKKKVTEISDKVASLEHTASNIEATLRVAESYTTPEPTREVSVVQTDVDGLSMRVLRAQGILASLEKMRQYDQLREEIKRAKAYISNLNWVVKQFKDGEATNRLIGDKLGLFTAGCNKAGLVEEGYEMSYRIDGKAIELLMQGPDDKEPIPLRHHSSGRRLLAAISVAEAFADSGAVILLDDCNHMDADLRKSTIMRLRERSSSSIWCATAWQGGDWEPVSVAQAIAPTMPVWVPPINKGGM